MAYGCALRNPNEGEVARLAEVVYELIFKDGYPPPHILLRDYARGVIETALHRGADLDVVAAKIHPPYRSEWPGLKIPPLDDLKGWERWDDVSDAERARVKIHGAVLGDSMDDFSRYVIGDFDEWSWEGLEEAHKPTHKDLHDQFVRSLTKRQKEKWDTYAEASLTVELCRRLEQMRTSDETLKRRPDQGSQLAEQEFVRTLRKKSRKYRLFSEHVAPYLADSNNYQEEDRFDGQLARRWMMGRIIQLGWTVERFGEFDWNADRWEARPDQSASSKRIGSKYQLIALYEVLARLSDNFKVREDTWEKRGTIYEGPWQIGRRLDIDPSNLLRKTAGEPSREQSNTWWFPTFYSSWENDICPVEWLRKDHDLPQVEQLLEVTRPSDSSTWFVLEAFYEWRRPKPLGDNREESEERLLWYMLKSYLVKKRDLTKLLAWAKRQNFMGRWMRESPGEYEIFLGEYHWAPAFLAHNVPYFGRLGWTRGDSERIPAPLLVTAERYFHDGSIYDCSYEDRFSINLPCKLIADGMNLTWNGVEGHFFDRNGELTAFDPSVREPGPGAVLVRREPFLEFLKNNDYGIIWTILGEKQAYDRSWSRDSYQGRLEINGAFTLNRGVIKGSRKAKFKEPPSS